ncbi:hypothetical protein ADUPG1_004680 [Aduncisulcus paluster]|uniref:Uncharacterized protein n=1 Tax=Aduncisulcus paluster TaxID=2918883 RepID=A0ABQ5K5W3_9EUKA|nr:hypothetical protein ADUPG1_004680 [Aduncisulcus paluster]
MVDYKKNVTQATQLDLLQYSFYKCVKNRLKVPLRLLILFETGRTVLSGEIQYIQELKQRLEKIGEGFVEISEEDYASLLKTREEEQSKHEEKDASKGKKPKGSAKKDDESIEEEKPEKKFSLLAKIQQLCPMKGTKSGVLFVDFSQYSVDNTKGIVTERVEIDEEEIDKAIVILNSLLCRKKCLLRLAHSPPISIDISGIEKASDSETVPKKVLFGKTNETHRILSLPSLPRPIPPLSSGEYWRPATRVEEIVQEETAKELGEFIAFIQEKKAEQKRKEEREVRWKELEEQKRIEEEENEKKSKGKSQTDKKKKKGK